MNNKFIELKSADSESLGAWHILDKTLTDDWFENLARDYDDSEECNEKGWDGFSDFVYEKTNKIIQRIYLEEIWL